MRNLIEKLVLLTIVIATFVACDKPVPEGEKPVVTLASQSIEVDSEGGDYTLRYSIANPSESATLSFDYDAEWITTIDSESGNIRLSIACNDGAEREAEVRVNYERAEPATFTVRQKGAAPDAFVLTLEELTGTSCITKVTPQDKEMYYVMYKSDIDYFYDSSITNDDELFEDDMFYFKRGAAFDGLTLKEYMERNKVLFRDVTRAAWPDLRPARRQVLYVYGIEFNEALDDCTRVTDVQWMLIDPPMAELKDITFDVSYTVDGANVAFDITPNGWEGYYTVQIFDYNEELYCDASEGISDDYVRSVGEGWIAMFGNNLDGGLSVEQILDFAGFKGRQQPAYELGSYVLYSAVIYAVEEVDGFYQMVSRPTVVNFSTEQVEASEMTINIVVDNLYVRVCDLVVTPSVNDETYALLLMPTEYLAEGYTDETLLDLALGEYSYYTNFLRGEARSHVSNLYPATEYILYAFGYSGGVVTTPIFKNIFTTEAEGECELQITAVNYGGPYRPSELKALDPERFANIYDGVDDYMFLVWTEIITDIPTNDEFVYVVDTLTYDDYGYDTIFFDLLISTCDPVEIALLKYDWEYYICAAAFDYKGNVTPMWRSEPIEWLQEDVRPAEELLEKLDSSTRAHLMMVDGRTGKISAVGK